MRSVRPEVWSVSSLWSGDLGDLGCLGDLGDLGCLGDLGDLS